MSCRTNASMSICGNFVKPTKRRPKNWIERGYKITVPFKFEWRATLGDVECDCTQMEEWYQPWYGFTWYHMAECAIGKHLTRYPGISNLIEVDFPMITQSE